MKLNHKALMGQMGISRELKEKKEVQTQIGLKTHLRNIEFKNIVMVIKEHLIIILIHTKKIYRKHRSKVR
jgi:hypothetical protein